MSDMVTGKLILKSSDNLSPAKRLTIQTDYVLLDIEGVTTSVEFVKEELFPYFEQHVYDYVKKHWEDVELQNVVSVLEAEALQDANDKLPGMVSLDRSSEEAFQRTLVENLIWQMKNNRKREGLKTIQGLVWKNGYENRKLEGHIYRDADFAIKFWKMNKKNIYIYSSGSIEAQKLLFKYNCYGDLNEYISGNFDTTIGSKLDMMSYKKIAEEIGAEPEKILFFSDQPLELFTAKKAGMKTVLVIRRPEYFPYKEQAKYIDDADGFVYTLEDVVHNLFMKFK